MTENDPRAMAAAQPVADLSKAPMPNVKTLKSRHNLFGQFAKFVGFNLRIMRMVLREGEH
jgi:hypothetical protein